ncbi:hypothetical protein [Spiroplasma culicicola]|uniref:Uncharacterized protein n=1 Tax=Spiroplasma culicicola AES-1 TaxID=1276246 RepID=W6A6L5_9MOLU|nr:hypothetical protein [Spiroplasma culicicola]AHI52723.1 hypothetical protein SCULI_v1c03820 [Spiroplasma culicicola AES-1]
MAKNNTKETIKDFKLIGDRTKQRIIGLIEKRLTAQTIMLFAQEYESYDAEIRNEIIEFIMFLLNREEEALRLNEAKIADQRAKMIMERRKMEFQEKQSNFKKIQDMLSKTEANKKRPVETTTKLKVTKPEPKPKVETKPKAAPKPEVKAQPKPKVDSKLEQMLKEAQLREQKMAREEKQRQEELAQQQKLAEAAKAKEVKQKAAAKPKAAPKPKTTTASNKVSRTPSKKPLSYEERLFASQAGSKTTQERDYEKEQKEKERLWQELYGKTREQSLGERQKIVAKDSKKDDVDKTPTIEEVKLTDFRLNGVLCPIDELTDPKNKLYVFWSKIKAKYRTANISAWLREKPLKFQRKIYKKRMKTLNRFNKLVENNTPKPEKAPVEKPKVKDIKQLKEVKKENKKEIKVDEVKVEKNQKSAE